ncbi:hypothetical protein ERO13_A11G155466v2 [Gossypium hirsutum]|nr:hypothetical protein ERO13_A11G155466v2 [Gossypium hirsutum]
MTFPSRGKQTPMAPATRMEVHSPCTREGIRIKKQQKKKSQNRRLFEVDHSCN